MLFMCESAQRRRAVYYSRWGSGGVCVLFSGSGCAAALSYFSHACSDAQHGAADP